MSEYLKASESVTEGHPDKICDSVAAGIQDAAIIQSLPTGISPRVAMEVSVKGTHEGGVMMLFGEVTLPPGVSVDYETVARNVVGRIGYTDPAYGFYDQLPELIIHINQQSSDIAHGVDENLQKKKRTGAGDQGLMIGGAVAGEGPELMPLPIMLAHALTDRYTQLYKNGQLPYLRPDGKSQVVVAYEDDTPKSVRHITIAASHDPLVQLGQVRHDVYQQIVLPVLDEYGFGIDTESQLIINGAGSWTVFGPLADAGTTNRKIIVDSYGGYFSHGGGGFNGKDWTKVDVAGAVGARYLAKAIVAGKLARRVQVEVSYAIGHPYPLGIDVHTYGTETLPHNQILDLVRDPARVDMSVDGINEQLSMNQPIYSSAAVGGWFGRAEFPWEHIGSL